MTQIKKAIIPIAGLGTRFLPLTKVLPKELWPLVDKPVIQYIVEEARASGIEEIIFVIRPDKKEVEKLFHEFGDSIQSVVEAPEVSLYFGQKFFLFDLEKEDFPIEPIVEILIFFREFSAQLNGYLQAHRTIWEKSPRSALKKLFDFGILPKLEIP